MRFAIYLLGMFGNDAGINKQGVFFMARESNAEKARRALNELGKLCYCMQPVPQPGNCCGTIMHQQLGTISYSGTKCARCKGMIPGTVH